LTSLGDWMHLMTFTRPFSEPLKGLNSSLIIDFASDPASRLFNLLSIAKQRIKSEENLTNLSNRFHPSLASSKKWWKLFLVIKCWDVYLE
jgi:hypothetical protein